MARKWSKRHWFTCRMWLMSNALYPDPVFLSSVNFYFVNFYFVCIMCYLRVSFGVFIQYLTIALPSRQSFSTFCMQLVLSRYQQVVI